MISYTVTISSSHRYLAIYEQGNPNKMFPYVYRAIKYLPKIGMCGHYTNNNLFEYFNKKYKDIPKKMKR